MKIKQFIVYIIIIVITGCESSDIVLEDKFGGTLKYSAPSSPTIIHPFLTHDSISVHLVPLIFNGLIKIDKNGNIIPDLVKSYEIKKKGLEYKFVLKKGIKFHDGKELTGKDIKFTYEKIKEIYKKNPSYDYDFSMVKKIELIDKYNIIITLKQPFAPFLYFLSVGIIPEHIYQGKDDLDADVYWHPIGTGSFKLDHIDNKEIILTSYGNYFGGKPYLDKIICNISPPATIWSKLLIDEVDYSRDIPLNLLKEFKKVNFLKTYNILEQSLFMLFFNCEAPLFRDKRTRQALNYAIDKELMINKVLHGQGEVPSSSIHPYNWAFDSNLEAFEYNPKKALKLLEEVGWKTNKKDGFLYKDGKLFSFKCFLLKIYPNTKEPTIFIQRQLQKIGIKMELKLVHTIDEFYQYKKDGELNAWFTRMETGGEPDLNYFYFHSSRIGTTNFFNYKNVEIDRLLDLGRKTVDQKERKKIYSKFQEILLDEPHGIFAFYKYTSIAIHRKFQNALPDEFQIFRGIEKWWIDKNWEKHP